MTDPKGYAKPHSKPTDIDELGKKLDAINAKRKPEAEHAQTSGSNMAEGLKYASEFSAAVLVGAALGWGVDKLTGISPFGLLGGLFLGLCAGVLNVVRAAKEGMDGSGEDLPPSELYEDEDA